MARASGADVAAMMHPTTLRNNLGARYLRGLALFRRRAAAALAAAPGAGSSGPEALGAIFQPPSPDFFLPIEGWTRPPPSPPTRPAGPRG